MFMLYGVVIGLVAGLLLRGRPAGLAALELRWAPVMVAGLLAQVVLFADPVASRVGTLGPPLYVASTLVVFAAVARNLRIPGMVLVLAGAACNLVAIIANGGFMPASPTALEALHRVAATGYSNSAVIAAPALPWLTDILALPGWLPWANVFSIGDALIAVGVAVVIAAAMRTRPSALPAAGAAAITPETVTRQPG